MLYYIWANDDCQNKTDYLEEAIQTERELLEDCAENVYIVDENNVIVNEDYVEASNG